MNYSAMLMDCQGCSEQDRREAEALFCNSLDAELGTPSDVARAYAAQDAIFKKYEELPLPKEASDEERKIVDRWETAQAKAFRAAFAGWYRTPDAAHFEITVA